MNVFDLRGPEFLLFYGILSVFVLALTVLLRRALDGESAPMQPAQIVSDPYLVAQLRGGSDETLRVALLSLLDRDLLEYDNGTVRTKKDVEPGHARRPIEQQILGLYRHGGDLSLLAGAAPACDAYDDELRRLKLIPDDAIRARRTVLFVVMLLILGGVGLTKIAIGIQRDRPVLFLVLMTAAAVLLLWGSTHSRRTRHGQELLSNVRTLFEGLRSRADTIRGGGATSELALVAAVFGIAAVPETAFPYRKALFPHAATSSSGSSCGSSSSSCGSSSCGGGGGCGGGGCGGCGS